MKGKKQLRRRNAVANSEFFAQQPCANCGERGKHFVSPSLGESGFYICAIQPQVPKDVVRTPSPYDIGAVRRRPR